MRRFRHVAFAALLLAPLLVLTPVPAAQAAVGPLSLFALDDDPDGLINDSALVLRDNDGNRSSTTFATRFSLQIAVVNVAADGTRSNMSINLSSPQPLNGPMTIDTADPASTSSLLLRPVKGGLCYFYGTVTVHELVTIARLDDPDYRDVVTAALSFAGSCQSAAHRSYGEVRWRSTVGLHAPEHAGVGLSGPVRAGALSDELTWTVGNGGTEPLVLGQLRGEGEHTEDLVVTSDSCSGRTVVFGQSCDVRYRVRPDSFVDREARFVLPDNSRRGHRAHEVRIDAYRADVVYASRRTDGRHVLKTAPATFTFDNTPRLLLDDGGDLTTPAAAPGGAQVAACSASARGAARQLVLLSTRQPVAPAPLTADGVDSCNPAFSPDGRWVAFDRAAGSTRALRIVDVATRAITDVPGGTGLAQPTWSPSGRMLAVADVAGAGLVLLRPDGTGRRTLPGTSGCDAPTWSGLGDRLAARCSTSDGRNQVVLVSSGSGQPPQPIEPDQTSDETAPEFGDDGAVLASQLRRSPSSRDVALVRLLIGAPVDASARAEDGVEPTITTAPPAQPDVTAPAPVSGVQVRALPDGGEVTWIPPTTADLAEVDVRAGSAGAAAPATPAEGTRLATTGDRAVVSRVAPGQTVRVSIFAIDAAGHATRVSVDVQPSSGTSPSPSPTGTPTESPRPSPSPSPSPAPDQSSSPAPDPSSTPTASSSPRPSSTPAPSSSPTASPTPSSYDEPGLKRLSGADRYETAAAIVRDSFPTAGVPVVVIATGENYADALAGGPAAHALRGPVLPVTRAAIPISIRTELARLRPGRIVVLGGSSAVDDAVVRALQQYTNGAVSRLQGSNRYDTAAQIARAVFAGATPHVVVATGNGFADALAGGAAAASSTSPVLLVTNTSVPTETADALRQLRPGAITVLGGEGAVSQAVVEQLRQYTLGTVTRLSGSDRYATAAQVAERFWRSQTRVVYLATGRNFPDALAGVPAAGLDGAPLLLVEPHCMPASVRRQLDRLKPQTTVILGGRSTVTDAAVAGTPCSG